MRLRWSWLPCLWASFATAAPLPQDAGARVEQLAEGVYAIIHADATPDWPHGNTGVIVTREGVLVIDSNYLPSRARADIALIRRLTDQPVRWLVNTHWHFDHNNGNAVYRQTFPGLRIISARPNIEYITLNSTSWSRRVAAPESFQRKTLAEAEQRLAAGKDAEGAALDAAARRALTTEIAQRRGEIEELTGLAVTPPDLGFDASLHLELGGRRIELTDQGRGNSPADVTVYLPDERVLFTGDLLVLPVPYAFRVSPTEWVEVLRRLERVPIAALVPGHGPVQADHAYTRQVRELFEAVRVRVRPLMLQGNTLDQVKAKVDLKDLRAKFVTEGDASAAEVWTASIEQSLVEAVFYSLRG